MDKHQIPVEVTPPPTLFEPLMSVKQTAKVLGISEKTLRDWVWRKKIDYVKTGDRVMFEPEAIRQFIVRNRVNAQPRVM
jgi:excisionase family DNA binding protein